MARKGLDVKKLFLASALIIGLGIVFVILSTILQLLTNIISGPNLGIIETINTAYSILLYPLFLALYLWCGIRAARKYGFEPVGAGLVTSFSYLIIAVVQLVLDIILTLIFVSSQTTSVGFGSVESAMAAFFFGPTADISGVGLSAVCGVGVILFGLIINFVVGGFGAILALRRARRNME